MICSNIIIIQLFVQVNMFYRKGGNLSQWPNIRLLGWR
nr:MAG TPA: hypothetical protein [Caudoviricetes sp.]